MLGVYQECQQHVECSRRELNLPAADDSWVTTNLCVVVRVLQYKAKQNRWDYIVSVGS